MVGCWLPHGRLEMYRIALKFPCNGLSRISSRRCSRLYLTSRYFQSRTYSSKICPPSPSKKGRGTGFLYTLGTLTVITGGALAYAKYDPDFRRWMCLNVPYSENVLQSVFQENQTYQEQITCFFNYWSTRLWELLFGKNKPKQSEYDVACPEVDETPEYTPPRSAFAGHVEPTPEESNWTEIRVINKDEGDIEVVQEKPLEAELDPDSLPATHPKNLKLLEEQISTAAAAAINAYSDATCSLRDYNEDVYFIIENSVDKLDAKVWNNLRKKAQRKEKVTKEAEAQAKQARENLEKLKILLQRNAVDPCQQPVIDRLNRNLVRIMDDVDAASEMLEKERKQSNLTDKYWEKVEAARKHFMEELEILFPSLDITNRDLKIGEGEFDLFMMHTFRTVLFYQKELYKLEVMGQERIRKALEAAGEEASEAVIRAKVESELEKERRQMALDFHKKMLQVRAETEHELRQQMKRQTQAHLDHLKDIVAMTEQEVERRLYRELDNKLLQEQSKYKMQLAGMVGRMRGIDEALKARAEADKNAHTSQVLWAACQALYNSLKTSEPGVPWRKQLHPLDKEVTAVGRAATPEDQLVQAVVNGIPREALNRGVYPEDALRERFLKVERVARRLALVPEGGSSLPVYLLSYLQSFLLIKAVNPIPRAELADEPVNLGDLDTYDILQRARYWLDRGDFSQTLKYMNLLKGGPKCIADDWMYEARILLETQQAANVLMAHAAAFGLLYL